MCLVCQLRKFAILHLQMHPVLECKVHVNDIKYEREESMCSANPEEPFCMTMTSGTQILHGSARASDQLEDREEP